MAHAHSWSPSKRQVQQNAIIHIRKRKNIIKIGTCAAHITLFSNQTSLTIKKHSHRSHNTSHFTKRKARARVTHKAHHVYTLSDCQLTTLAHLVNNYLSFKVRS